MDCLSKKKDEMMGWFSDWLEQKKIRHLQNNIDRYGALIKIFKVRLKRERTLLKEELKRYSYEGKLK